MKLFLDWDKELVIVRAKNNDRNKLESLIGLFIWLQNLD